MTTDVTIELRKREQLLNVVERRSLVEPLEFRENKATGELILEGYASTFDPYDAHGGPDAGGWIEQLSRRAFDGTLSEQPDVQLLINHGGEPLARTAHGSHPGTMKLSTDDHGLYVQASLDPTDPDVLRIKPKMMRGDMDEMSFAFRVLDQEWDGSYTERTITQLSLEKGDVSVVNYGMNPHTKAIIQVGEAVGALAQLSDKQLLEVRSHLDHDAVKRARAMLAQLDVREVSKADAKPYGDVAYADPGYKSDGRKRYPIDTEAHARAAWSYINMPKNQKSYSSSQVDNIKNRIKAALKKFGVEVGDDDKKGIEGTVVDGLGVSHYDAQRNAAGGTTLIAVMTDGTRVPLPAQAAAAVRAMPDEAPHQPFTGPTAQPLIKGSADAHDEPYSKGPEVGPVPNDRPNLTVGSGAGLGAVDANEKGPTVSKELLAMDDEPADEPENEPDADDEKKADDTSDSPTMQDRAACPGGDGCPGDDCPEHGTEAKSDDMDESAYDPETGEGRADVEPDENDETKGAAIDLGMAEALDRTIVHAYRLSKDADVRKLLEAARTQLSTLRGLKPAEDTDISRRMTELRNEVGQPDTGTVSESLKYLMSAGTLPVGYRGLVVKADPDCHVTTAAERLAYEAKDKAVRATEDATAAELRLKEARRLAELNGAIARKRARESV